MPEDPGADDEDPLTSLYIDRDDFDREKLSKVLTPLVGIDRESYEPRFRRGWAELSSKKKCVVYLLYRKAIRALGHVDAMEEGVPGREIAEETGVEYNSVRSYLSRIPFIENDQERGGWLVPAHGLDAAISYLEDT